MTVISADPEAHIGWQNRSPAQPRDGDPDEKVESAVIDAQDGCLDCTDPECEPKGGEA